MDPVASAVVLTGLRKAKHPTIGLVTNLLSRLLGPAADAAGETLAAPLRDYNRRRAQRATALVLSAGKILEARGVEPKVVPGRVLVPILEKGSIEEDVTLRRKWAAMLANAAIPDNDAPVLASFPHLLSELTPLEVRILEFIFTKCEETDSRVRPHVQVHVFRASKVMRQFKIKQDLCAAIRDNLVRLNFLQAAWGELNSTNDSVSDSKWPHVATSLAHCFHDACSED